MNYDKLRYINHEILTYAKSYKNRDVARTVFKVKYAELITEQALEFIKAKTIPETLLCTTMVGATMNQLNIIMSKPVIPINHKPIGGMIHEAGEEVIIPKYLRNGR